MHTIMHAYIAMYDICDIHPTFRYCRILHVEFEIGTTVELKEMELPHKPVINPSRLYTYL